MNLGSAHGSSLNSEEDGGEYTHHYFQVQEFRRPEFEITTRASEAPHFVGSSATATMTAAYYSGGGLADTEVDWTVTFEADQLHAAKSRRLHVRQVLRLVAKRSTSTSDTNAAIVQRTHRRRRQTHAEDGFRRREAQRARRASRPQARVQDVNRQTLAASTTLLVHPADVYVGLEVGAHLRAEGRAI